jgi:hypothetical protein
MAMTRQDAINDALARLHDVGFTMMPGFSEHGPMVAETISTLGHDDAVAGWVETYKAKRRHIPSPPPQKTIDGTDERDWRGAIGVYARTTDWHRLFLRALAEQPWQDTIRKWVPILLEGYIGALTHGLIRTAHAVRSFPKDGSPTDLQLDELARGLASWAAGYQMVAGNPDVHGNLTLAQALHRLPRAAPEAVNPGAPPALLRELPAATEKPVMHHDLPGFAAAIESLRGATDADSAISRHTAIFARLLVAHPEIRPIPLIQLVHSITAPVALRNLLPYFSPEFGAWAYSRAWQGSAAIVARVVSAPISGSETDPAIGESALAADELARRAVEHRDEHAIKLTEALLREDRIRPDPVYRVAAETIQQRLPAWS